MINENQIALTLNPWGVLAPIVLKDLTTILEHLAARFGRCLTVTLVLLGAGFLDGSRGLLIARMAARGVNLKFQKLGKLVHAERTAKNRGAT